MTIPGMPVGAREGTRLLQQHYRTTQHAIAQRGTRAIQVYWRQTMDPQKFSKSWYTLGPVVNGVVSTHASMSAAQASQYYGNVRVINGYRAAQVPSKIPSEEYIDSVMGAMGPGAFYHYLGEDYTDEEASDMTLSGLEGAAVRMIMMGGRDTVTDASVQDPVATGWERVAEAGACDFCMMLVGRGAVYSADTATFQAHDHCACVAAPVFESGGDNG